MTIFLPKGGKGPPSKPPSFGSVIERPSKAKRKKLLAMLRTAQYRPTKGETTCRGAVALGTDCGHCGKCKWNASRASLLSQ